MLSDKIKTLRTARGINQIELAKSLGVTKQCVSNWENDNIQPSVEMLIKIASFFMVTTDYLLGLEDDFGVKETEKSLRAYDHHEITDKQTVDLVKLYKALSDYNKAVVFGYVVRLIEESGLNVNSVLRN